MAKGDWPKSYVVPSLVLSGSALGLLVWRYVSPTAQVDAWTVTLLVVGFLPWLRTVFDTIAFPGGASIKYRQLEAKQEQQEEQIKALRFVVANFLTGDEQKYLRALTTSEPFRLDRDGDSRELVTSVENLLRLGFIEKKTKYNPAALLTSGGDDFKGLFGITPLGCEFLDVVEGVQEP